MKRIIVKKLDGGIIIINPNTDKFDDVDSAKRPFTELKSLQGYIAEGLDWFVTEQIIDKSQLESRKQLMHEGDKVVVDTNWEKRLMPDQLVKKKLLVRLEKELDDLLDLDTPDSIVVLKAKRDLDKLRILPAPPEEGATMWTQKALEGLDAKVASGEPDKPIIRQKLMEKLDELK